MSKKKSGATAGTKKKGSAFRTVFIVIFVILAVLGVFLIKPLFDLTLGNASGALGKVASFATVHFERLFGLDATLGGDEANAFYTGMIEWYMVLAVVIVLIFLFLLPIHLMKALKRDGKKHMAVRRIFLILSLLLDLALIVCGVLFVFRLHIGDFGTKTIQGLYDSLYNAFDGVLGKNVVVRFGGAVSHHAGFWIWMTIVCLVVLLLIDVLSSLGKKHAVAAEKGKKNKPEEVKEETEEEIAPVTNEIPEESVLIGAVSAGPLSQAKEKDEMDIGAVTKEGPTEEDLAQADKDLKALDEPMIERIVPTRHDLAILNTLEPFHTERVEKLPGMYPDEEGKNIANLEPSNEDKAASQKTAEGENGYPNILPGIDEYGADPWLDAPVEETSSLSGLSEAPSAKDDITSTVAPVEEETNYVEEVVPEEAPVEEVVEEQPVEEETVEEEVVEEQPVEEEVVEWTPEEEPEEVEYVEEQPVEEVVEEPVEEQVEEVVEEVIEEPVPEEAPVEEDNSADKEEHQKLLEEEANKANTPLAENEWNVGEYDPEAEKKAAEEEAARKAAEEEAAKKAAEEAAKKAAEEEAAKKAAEEAAKKAAEEEAAKKAAEEAAKKPVASVKQMKPLTPTHLGNNGPKPTPITPVAPVKQEEAPIEEVPEEKKIAPISGPMHTINKPIDKSTIKPVEAKHVAFDLKRYQVKTYKGNLTAEEAFQKGVTKVQPTVQPTFQNSNDNEASWKQKRRQEEIRKNGYKNVSTVQNLKPVQKPAEVKADTTNAGSIRDLLKANKAAEEAKAQNEANKPEEAEENKPARPVTPIKPVTPVKKDEEPKAEESPEVKPVAKPLAPIHKPTAPTNRPKPTAIKPVKPVTPKK